MFSNLALVCSLDHSGERKGDVLVQLFVHQATRALQREGDQVAGRGKPPVLAGGEGDPAPLAVPRTHHPPLPCG